jgi:predicted transposase YdaD
MILSEELEQQCWSELTAFEEERNVTYVTTGERIGFERGIAEGEERGRTEGKLEGELALVLRQLSRRFGSLSPNTQTQIQSLSLPQIEALSEALLDFSTPDDLTHWLQDIQA